MGNKTALDLMEGAIRNKIFVYDGREIKFEVSSNYGNKSGNGIYLFSDAHTGVLVGKFPYKELEKMVLKEVKKEK